MVVSVKLVLVASVSLFVEVGMQAMADCPSGWSHHGESCYFLHKGALNWEMAKVVCDAVNGYLVSIDTAFENNFVASLLKLENASTAWIGLEDFVVEGEFVWTHTQELPEFTNWNSGNPSDSGGNEDCGAIYSDGHWNDFPCESRHLSFVCEAPSNSGDGVIG